MSIELVIASSHLILCCPLLLLPSFFPSIRVFSNESDIHIRWPFNITVIQVYAPTSNAEKAEVAWFYEDLQDLLELTPNKDVLFIIGDWNAKVRNQETPGVTGKFGLGVQNEVEQRLINRVLPRERTGHSKHPLPRTQEKTLHINIMGWSIPKSDWLYSLQPKMEKLYTVSKDKTGSWLWLISWAAWFGSLLPNSDLNWRK